MCLFQLPTKLFSKNNLKYQSFINRKTIFETFRNKIIFIKKFLNTITQLHCTTFDTIHYSYKKKNRRLQKGLRKLPKLKQDSTLSVNEIVDLLIE